MVAVDKLTSDGVGKVDEVANRHGVKFTSVVISCEMLLTSFGHPCIGARRNLLQRLKYVSVIMFHLNASRNCFILQDFFSN